MSTRDATDVFSEWALIDRDEGMESGHAKSVNEMLNIVIPMLKKTIHSNRCRLWKWLGVPKITGI